MRSILLGAHSQYRGVMTEVARRFRADTGGAVHLYCATAQEEQYYRRNGGGLFDTVNVANALYQHCRAPVADTDRVIARARENEKWLGVTYNQLAVSDRHLGRGYALGGFKHPRSIVSEETDYLGLVNGYNAAVGFWAKEISENAPDVIINCGKIAAVIARASGIPYRVLAASRYKNYHYWSVNEFFENPHIENLFRDEIRGDSLDFSEPYTTHLEMRQIITRQNALTNVIKRSFLEVSRQLYWRMRGYEKGKGYYIAENIRFLIRSHRDERRVTGNRALSLADLRGQRFVYYPLHTEPEAALQALSPEYFYQLSSIAALSRDLPAGVLLAVKETFAALGRRPTDFYDQIAEFKNVVMIDATEFGLHVAEAAEAVATITGTGGFEAAAMGKPVITFGRHNLYSFLPHVMVVTDESALAGYLARALDGDIDREQARRDGARFVSAVVKASFDLRDYKVTRPDHIDEAAAKDAYRALIDGLAGRERQPPSAVWETQNVL